MAYFDNAATTYPKPEIVYNFMNDFYRNYGLVLEEVNIVCLKRLII